jgi:sulfite exporter TauE/SafE
MEAFAGLALGIAASLHCGAMCGPLVIALHGGVLPAAGRGTAGASKADWWTAVILHHGGRALTYGALGLAAGLLGAEMMTGGFGRALSMGAGALLLMMALGLAAPFGNRLARGIGGRVGQGIAWLRGGGGSSGGWRAVAIGALNALLPCGLVYAALVAAVAIGTPGSAAAFMILFGVGTTPVLVGLGRSAQSLPTGLVGRRLLRPVALALVGLLLVWRGIAGPAVHGSHGADSHQGHAEEIAPAAATAAAAR